MENGFTYAIRYGLYIIFHWPLVDFGFLLNILFRQDLIFLIYSLYKMLDIWRQYQHFTHHFPLVWIPTLNNTVVNENHIAEHSFFQSIIYKSTWRFITYNLLALKTIWINDGSIYSATRMKKNWSAPYQTILNLRCFSCRCLIYCTYHTDLYHESYLRDLLGNALGGLPRKSND